MNRLAWLVLLLAVSIMGVAIFMLEYAVRIPVIVPPDKGR